MKSANYARALHWIGEGFNPDFGKWRGGGRIWKQPLPIDPIRRARLEVYTNFTPETCSSREKRNYRKAMRHKISYIPRLGAQRAKTKDRYCQRASEDLNLKKRTIAEQQLKCKRFYR
jgi:hypothetical protein